MFNIKEGISPAIDFIKAIKPKDKVAIVHGHDPDSICSAAILYKLVKSKVRTAAKLVVSELNSYLTEKTFNKLKKNKPSYTIIVDIPNISVDVITKMRKFSKIMIVDHHIPRGYAKITYVNPRIYDRDSYLPTAYLCYKIYEGFSDPKEIAWVAAIGTLSDMGMKNCLDLFNKIKTEYKDLVDGLKPDDNILVEKSLLWKLTQMVESGMIIRNAAGAIFSLKALIEAKKYKDVINNKTLTRYQKLVESEFQKIEKDFNKNKKIIDSILLFEIKSKLNLKSAFSNYIKRLFDDKILLVYHKDRNYISISLRRGEKIEIDLDSLAKEAIRDIKNASGGGHPTAAGIRVPARQFKKLLENMRLRIKLESMKS